MLLRIDHSSSLPLHDQLAAQLRKAIASGDPAAGDRLPPARELAKTLDVNVHTLLRAYQTLRDEGILEVRRGRGTIVTNGAANLAELSPLVAELVTQARHQGLTDNDIRSLLEIQL